MAGYSPITVARFWSKVDVKWSAQECWEWKGARRSGYGNIKIGGVSHTSSRVAYEIANQTTLGEKMALHKCDNKLCCNPSHIYAGSPSDNMKDMHERLGRKIDTLTPDDVRDIRERLGRGAQNKDLADIYGVSRAHISKIKTGLAWGGGRTNSKVAM